MRLYGVLPNRSTTANLPECLRLKDDYTFDALPVHTKLFILKILFICILLSPQLAAETCRSECGEYMNIQSLTVLHYLENLSTNIC